MQIAKVRWEAGIRTALEVANFFSVATMPPLRWAALSALLPLTTVSRGPAGPPRVREPILVTWSQSSLIVSVVRLAVRGGWGLRSARAAVVGFGFGVLEAEVGGLRRVSAWQLAGVRGCGGLGSEVQGAWTSGGGLCREAAT
jgi:hypothetical protein